MASHLNFASASGTEIVTLDLGTGPGRAVLVWTLTNAAPTTIEIGGETVGDPIVRTGTLGASRWWVLPDPPEGVQDVVVPVGDGNVFSTLVFVANGVDTASPVRNAGAVGNGTGSPASSSATTTADDLVYNVTFFANTGTAPTPVVGSGQTSLINTTVVGGALSVCASRLTADASSETMQWTFSGGGGNDTWQSMSIALAASASGAALAAAPAATASVSAALSVAKPLAVALSATAAVTASLRGVAASLAAGAAAAATVTATLTGAPATLAAAPVASASVTATLRSTAAQLGASPSAVALTTASLSVAKPLAAAPSASAAASATLRGTAAQFAAGASASATTSATLSGVTAGLAGSPVASATVVATLRLQAAQLAAAASAAASSTASLTSSTAALAAAPLATATATAALTQQAAQLAASAGAGATVQASVTGAVANRSGLLCPTLHAGPALTPRVTCIARLTPTLATALRYAPRLYLSSRCSDPMAIDPEIFADNDGNLAITDLPTGLTVEWGIVALGVGGTPPGPGVALDSIHADVSGLASETGSKPAWMTELGLPDSATGIYYTDVLEGAAITQRLLPTYEDEQVALVARVGQDVRVYGTTTVRAARLANA